MPADTGGSADTKSRLVGPFRVTPEEELAAKTAASELGVTMTDLIRLHSLNWIIEKGRSFLAEPAAS